MLALLYTLTLLKNLNVILSLSFSLTCYICTGPLESCLPSLYLFTEKTVTVIFPYNGKLEGELDIVPCDIITVDDWDVSDDWAKGTLNGKTGLFFKAFVKPSSEVPSPDNLKLEEVRGKPEGYEATYRGKEYVLKEKLEDVECVVCREVAHELRQTSCCGKTICLGCAETWKKTRTSGTSGSCPECREDFDAIKDPRTQRRLTGTSVHCPMYSLGCDWVGGFGRVKQHAKNECPFEMVKCTDVNCKEKVPRRFLELHKTQLCQKRSVACPSCDLATRPGLLNPLPLRYSDIITKHWLECPMWPTRCPDACDPYLTLTRCELASHMKKCSKARIECKFARVGCKMRVKEEEMDEHLRDAKDEHLTAVFEKYTKAKEDIAALTSKCKELEKENTTICEKHKTLVEEHSKIKEENAKLKSFLSTPLPHPLLMHEFFHSRH